VQENLLLLGAGWTKPNWAWAPFKRYAQKRGYDAFLMDYPHRGFLPIQYSARRAKEEIDLIVRKYEKVTFLGHSMGGLVGRYLIQCLGMDQHITSYVSVGTPHYGTYAAYLAPWSHSARQMRPRSPFLNKLNDLPWPKHIDALSIRGGLEEVVIPQKNARFRPAIDLVVPKSDHLSLVVDLRMWRTVLDWLREPALLTNHQLQTANLGSALPLPSE